MSAVGDFLSNAFDAITGQPQMTYTAPASSQTQSQSSQPQQATPSPQNQPFINGLQQNSSMFKNANDFALKTTGVSLPSGYVPSLYAKESSFGSSSAKQASYNSKIGTDAWRFGLTPIAVKQLQSKGIKVDLNSPQGAANAAAAYAALMVKNFNDPKEYAKHYWGGPQKEQANIADQFGSIYKDLSTVKY